MIGVAMRYEYIAEILNKIFLELKEQRDIYEKYPNGILDFDVQMRNLDEYINSADEFGVAYEIIVVLLEKYSFKISGGNAVGLLEIGLVFGFKTSRDVDAQYSRR
ncbi:hypothetical protein Daci_1430 [Delftia acidovorans SPH-1]|uniref:MafI family immunity protein n=2 Tax=Comamonadaceae TaxID=80864 RepID=A9BSR9_DELAS|nr:hypothetical protein Daci_1430 [Delftia acidovorans SPH-1]